VHNKGGLVMTTKPPLGFPSPTLLYVSNLIILTQYYNITGLLVNTLLADSG
jgi:hypothetical protein